MARVLHISSTTLSSEILKTASDCIRSNGVLAVATESFYALAAGVKNLDAIQRVHTIKGDRNAKPILLLVSSKAQVFDLASAVPSIAEILIDQFWPGPLTLVLPAAPSLSMLLTGETGSIGVRQPNHSQLLQLLETTGPLTGTSANRSGMPPATTSKEVMQEIGNEIDVILDSGPSPGGSPSTLLSLVDGIRLLRQGPVSAEMIQDALNPLGLHLQDACPRS